MEFLYPEQISFNNFLKLAKFNIFVFTPEGLRISYVVDNFYYPKKMKEDLFLKDLNQIYESIDHKRLNESFQYALANIKVIEKNETSLDLLSHFFKIDDTNWLFEQWLTYQNQE